MLPWSVSWSALWTDLSPTSRSSTKRRSSIVWLMFHKPAGSELHTFLSAVFTFITHNSLGRGLVVLGASAVPSAFLPQARTVVERPLTFLVKELCQKGYLAGRREGLGRGTTFSRAWRSISALNVLRPTGWTDCFH